MEDQGRRQKLAHELGAISQLVYKHSSAHRGTKYFQALKKVDRHMYEFSKLKIFDVASRDKSENAEVRKRRAVALLSEVEGNCIKVIERCLPELALSYFVPFHSLVVATMSSLCAYIKVIKVEIQKSVKSRSTGKTQLKFPNGGNSGSSMHGSIAVDIGKKVPRMKGTKMKSKRKLASSPPETPDAKTARFVSPTNDECDLGIPIPRTLNQSKCAEGSSELNVGTSGMLDPMHNPASISNITLDVSLVQDKYSVVSEVNNNLHCGECSTGCDEPNLVKPLTLNKSDAPAHVPEGAMETSMGKSSHSVPNGGMNVNPFPPNISDKPVVHIDPPPRKPHTLGHIDSPGSPAKKPQTDQADKRTLHKTRELNILSNRNTPLRLKQYHVRFLLHCYRNNVSLS